MLVIGLGMPLCQMQYVGCAQICSIVGIVFWVGHTILVLIRKRLPVCILVGSMGCSWVVAVLLVFGVLLWWLGVASILLCCLGFDLLWWLVWFCVPVVGGASFGWLFFVVVVRCSGCLWEFVVVYWVGLGAVDASVLVR